VTNDPLEAAWAPFAAGIADSNLRGLYDDADGDGELNIIEWLTGSLGIFNIPDATVATDTQILVASYFANRGIVPLAINRGPFDDYDADGFSNIIELIFGSDLLSNASLPSTSPLEIFVAEELIQLNIIPGTNGNVLADVAPGFDYDEDGKSNIVELQNNTDPTDSGNTPATDAVDDLVAVYFAENGIFSNPAPLKIGPDDDFDDGGASNLVEIALQPSGLANDGGTFDFALDETAEVDAAVDLRIDSSYGTGSYTAAGNFDNDTYTNLEELALGTDPTVAN
jgi:hypothetical protein